MVSLYDRIITLISMQTVTNRRMMDFFPTGEVTGSMRISERVEQRTSWLLLVTQSPSSRRCFFSQIDQTPSRRTENFPSVLLTQTVLVFIPYAVLRFLPMSKVIPIVNRK